MKFERAAQLQGALWCTCVALTSCSFLPTQPFIFLHSKLTNSVFFFFGLRQKQMAGKQPFKKKKRAAPACLGWQLGGGRETLAGGTSEARFLPQTENVASVHGLLF